MKIGVASASMAITLLFLRVRQAIIPHLKEETQSYVLIKKIRTIV